MYVVVSYSLQSVLITSSTCQDFAYESSQKYKEGKFILERNLLVDVQ